jgi:Uma2 family endonuclease
MSKIIRAGGQLITHYYELSPCFVLEIDSKYQNSRHIHIKIFRISIHIDFTISNQ